MKTERLLEVYDKMSEAPDAIERLRHFVLDLAVRGKLVDQDTADEPASELLKRVSAEKARLVKEEKVRNKPDLPPVKPADQPHPIPNTWRWVRIANIVDFSAGRTPSRNDSSFWNTGDFHWVSIADMKDGKIVESTKETVSEKARKVSFKSEPELPGTMLMSFKLTIGKIARLGVPAFHNEAIISIRPHLAELDPYLFKVLPDLARSGKTKGAIKGATLNRESISNILIPLAPLAEQRRIVEKVDELMALLDRLEAARTEREATRDRLTTASLARLTAPDIDPEAFSDNARSALDALPALTTRPDQITQLRRAILNLAVRGRLVQQNLRDENARQAVRGWVDRLLSEYPKTRRVKLLEAWEEAKSSTPYQIPSSWVWATAEELCETIVDCPHTTPKFRESGIVCLDTNSVKSSGLLADKIRFVSEETYQKRNKRLTPRGGDIVFAREGSVGETVIIPPDLKCCLGQRVMLFRPGSPISPEWLKLTLSEHSSLQRLMAVHKGIGAKHVNVRDMRLSLQPVPPLAEQKRIVTKIDTLMALCDRLEATLGTANTSRARLLEATLHQSLESSFSNREAA